MPRHHSIGRPSPDAMARVARELSCLDPWTFWTVPMDDHLVVAGTTGVFLVVPADETIAGDHRRQISLTRPETR
jgi:hypothetical protein